MTFLLANKQFLAEDWTLVRLPLPTLVHATSLTACIQNTCRNVELGSLDSLETDYLMGIMKTISAMNDTIVSACEEKRELEVASSRKKVVENTLNKANQLGKTVGGAIISLFKKQETLSAENLAVTRQILMSDEVDLSNVPTAMKISDEEARRFSFVARQMEELQANLLRAAMKWIEFVNVLSVQRATEAVAEKIWTCEWRSGLEEEKEKGQIYQNTCLRVHSAMLAHTAAVLYFNCGRRYEIYKYESDAYRCFYKAFKIWNQLVMAECGRFNRLGELDWNLPAEMRTGAAIFFARLCVIKLQHSALLKYAFIKAKLVQTVSDPFKERDANIVDEAKKTMAAAKLSIQLSTQLLVLLKGHHQGEEGHLLDYNFSLLPTVSEDMSRRVVSSSLDLSYKYIEACARLMFLLGAYIFFTQRSEVQQANRALDTFRGFLKSQLMNDLRAHSSSLGFFCNYWTELFEILNKRHNTPGLLTISEQATGFDEMEFRNSESLFQDVWARMPNSQPFLFATDLDSVLLTKLTVD